MKKAIFIVGVTLAIAITFLFVRHADAPTGQQAKTSSTPSTTKPSPASFNKMQFPIDQPSSLWMIVNKERALPATYVPAHLSQIKTTQMSTDAATALNKLLDAAKAEKVSLKTISGYRSYTEQTSVYNNYVKSSGQVKADTFSARPGHSEHQTGLAVDLGNSDGSCDLAVCFATTAGGKWLAEHAHEFGFVIRYPEGKETITGYQYEPWHIRYLGNDLAAELHKTGQTMEEFFTVVPTKQPY